jgi:hypothetical protein
MKNNRLRIALLAIALCGPCITIERHYDVWGDRPAITVTVDKDEQIDIKPSIEANAIKASATATATANVSGAKASAE